MPTVGRRCLELRVRERGQNWRILVPVDDDAVVISGVFAKKTRATPAKVIDACRGAGNATTRIPEDELEMRRGKKERLERAGWRVGSTADFLELTKEEAALIEMKIGLAESLRRRRQARKLTQTQLAKRIGSSQPRVAKMEAADPSVSIETLVRALLDLGATRSQVAKAITKRTTRAA